jgi:uncharacterized SAM-binding protein YcdF (DUF218 family)
MSKLRLAGVVIAIALAALYFHESIFALLAGYLVHADPPQKADVAFVLAGDAFGNRIVKGAELEKQGYVPLVMVSGPSGNYGTHECDLAIPYAVHHGYPEKYFDHFENEARSTMDEAAAAIPEFRRRGYKHVIIVTSNYHTRRAGHYFRAADPAIDFKVVAADDKYFTPDGWWHNREARKIFFLEWEKTIGVWFGQ